VGGVDRLVAIGEIGARQQVQEVVGAGAAYDRAASRPNARPIASRNFVAAPSG